MFTNSLIDRHLDYSQFFVILSKAVINFPAHSFCGHMLSFLLGKFPGAELIDCIVNVC